MSRYLGPKNRIARRLGAPIFGPNKYLERKAYPPGEHGPRFRRKVSDYALALAEKQKLRFMYGIQEKQFRRYYETADRRRGITGETLLVLLELRLDNVVYRLGLATTRRAARQMCTHGHIRVNGRRVNIPSFQVRVGDEIEINPRQNSQQLARQNVEASTARPVPEWLQASPAELSGKVISEPTREQIQPIVDERVIVEFYSR
ncbi:MAG: 30S ribosomal protein S4 [Verrucomicrobiota bacterium]|jgi:small subunit ribosomal protein S4|nr:30S ribosomal protein S4 [Verrucomicrobiota bacterium]MDD8044828.1 30S ribosomal protein S4 [Verrucomicrobiota bacterium]MDD8049708.1 30S ribosomal protein S4 [Verrucomicrobiota bacterium]MDI9385760.1 30S ribosomal protein S4 [Verrucomicrobiota bacterium]HCF95345.1 30S ribosomal protein S4 [Verrucomicrobiota bacterium]